MTVLEVRISLYRHPSHKRREYLKALAAGEHPFKEIRRVLVVSAPLAVANCQHSTGPSDSTVVTRGLDD